MAPLAIWWALGIAGWAVYGDELVAEYEEAEGEKIEPVVRAVVATLVTLIAGPMIGIARARKSGLF